MHSVYFSNGADCRYPVHALALGMYSSAAVPRPSGSSFMPLRCTYQAPELRTGMVGSQAVVRQPSSQEQVGGVLSAAA
jgi:hypothetical protein